MSHPLVAKLAAAQAQRCQPAQPIDATGEIARRRVFADSYARARTVLAWAEQVGVRSAPCFCAIDTAIANNEPVALLLMAAWTDFPASQEAA